jgi:serine/threonine-protein kinase
LAHVLARQYELTTPIGRGPTGEVWRATDLNTRDSVAVKVLDVRLSADPTIVDRFVRERQVLTAFLHPSYVRVRDLLAGEGVIALVMEYVSGWDLRRHIGHSVGLQPSIVAEIGLGIAEALGEAHDAGVVHCDLKPSNVVLEEPSGLPRLTDCRVARLARGYQGRLAWYGDPIYASPEVISGGPPVPATDVYALGLILFEMLAGRPPYGGPDIDTVISGHLSGRPMLPATVPAPMRRLIEECLEVDPAARPPAREAALRLAQAIPPPEARASWTRVTPPPMPVVAASPPAPAPMRVDRDPPPSRRIPTVRSASPGHGLASRRVLTVVGALLVVAVVLAAIALFASGDDQAPTAAPGTTPATTPIAGTDTSPPELAASATPETLEGATAFTHYWFETLSYAVGTGDVSALQAASSPQCRACADALTVIRDGYRDRAALRGGVYTVRTVTTDSFWSVDKPNLRLVFDRSPRSALSPDGQLTEVFPGGGFLTCQVALERADGQWRMLEVLSPTPIV